MCETVTPQGILCVIKNVTKDIREELIKNKEKNVFILDGVQDPGNIGTIVRNAVAFDIKNISMRILLFCIEIIVSRSTWKSYY